MRQDPGRGTGSLDCVNFGGTSFNGNTSLMTGIEIICRHADGVGVRLSNADNLEFAFIRDQPVGGSGAALLVQAAVPGDSAGQITVRTISAGSAIKVEAVADRPGAVSVGDLHIIDLDGGNGTPMPVGPNIKVDNTGNATFVSTGSSLSGLALGNGVASAATARAYLANHPVFSAVVANQSNAGLAYLSNTTPTCSAWTRPRTGSSSSGPIPTNSAPLCASPAPSASTAPRRSDGANCRVPSPRTGAPATPPSRPLSTRCAPAS